MKWIGQKINTLPVRFRGALHIEGLATSSDTNILVVDNNGVVTKNPNAGGGGGGNQIMLIDVGDEDSNLTTGTAKKTFRIPYNFNISEIRANVNTAPVGSTVIVDVNQNGTSILSNKISIDASEKTSSTAASACVLSNPFLSKDDEITIDIDQIGSSTAGKGLKLVVIGTEITNNNALYNLTAASPTVNEGSSVVFNLATFNVSNGTSVSWEITGISSSDISGNLIGNFTVNNNAASQTITATADMTSESNEVMTMTAASKTAQVTIVNVNPTYSIARSAATVVEGSSMIFTLNTTGVPNGTNVSYQIQGIQDADITGSLTGNFTVQNNSAALTVTAVSDDTSEGGGSGETMTITAGGASQTCTILDPPTGRPYSKSLALDGVNDYFKMQATSPSGMNSAYYNNDRPVGTSQANIHANILTNMLEQNVNWSMVMEFFIPRNASPNGNHWNWDMWMVQPNLGWGSWVNHRALKFDLYNYDSYLLPRVWCWVPSNPLSGTNRVYGYRQASVGANYGGPGGGNWGHLTGTDSAHGWWHQVVITKGNSTDVTATRANGGFGFYLNGYESSSYGGYSQLTNNNIHNNHGNATFDMSHSSNDPLHAFNPPDRTEFLFGKSGTNITLTIGTLALYDKQLSISEINDLYDGGARAGGSADQAAILNQDYTAKSTNGNLRHYWYLDVDGQDSNDDSGTTLQDKKGDMDLHLGNTTIPDITSITTPSLPLFEAGSAPAAIYTGEQTTLTQVGSHTNSTVTWYSDSNRTSQVASGTTYTFTPSSTGNVTLYTKDVYNGVTQTGTFPYSVHTAGYSTHSYTPTYSNESLIAPYTAGADADTYGSTGTFAASNFTNGGFSLVFWFLTVKRQNTNIRIVNFANNSNSFIAFNPGGNHYPMLQCKVNNTWNYVYGNQGSEGYSATNWNVAESWKCLGFTYDPANTTVKVFTNGEKVGTLTHSNLSYDLVGNIEPHLKFTNITTPIGGYDNIGWYGDVLTEAEMIACQGGAGAKTPGSTVNLENLSGSSDHLIDYWKFQGQRTAGNAGYFTGTEGIKMYTQSSPASNTILTTNRP